MLYYTESEGTELKIEIIDEPSGGTRVKLPDGRELVVDLEAALENELFSLLVGGHSHAVHIERKAEDDRYEITLDGQVYAVKVETARQHRLAALVPRQNLHAGEAQIKAPMPGLVTIVAVEVGQTVESGQRIAVLEAMKMENELKTPKAGTVKAVNVQPGQTVEQNRILAIIE